MATACHSVATPALDFTIIIRKGIYLESTEKSKTTCTSEILHILGITVILKTVPVKQKITNFNHTDTCLLLRLTQIRNIQTTV